MNKYVKIGLSSLVGIALALFVYSKLSAPLKTLNRVSGAVEATMDRVDEEQADKLIDSLNTKMGEAGDKINEIDMGAVFDGFKKD